MKILQVLPSFRQGGAEHFVAELSISLNNIGEECDVVTLFDIEESNELAILLRENGVRTYSLHKHKGLDVSIFLKLINLIKREKYDVVHAHVGAIKYILLATFRFTSVRFFATIHSEASREAGRSLDLWSRKIMFNNKKCIPVTISKESELSYERFYGKRTHIIFNGVSEYKKKKEVSIRDNNEQIVFVHPASCQPVKNQDLLLTAFAKLTELYGNTKLIWVGDIESYMSLFEELKKKMVPQVVCLGEVPNVRDYLNEANAMCLTSKMEGLPMTVLESFSVGCVPICTPVGGCVDIIKDGENGFLSKNDSIDSYYSALKKYCDLTKEKKEMMKIASKESFKQYTIELCAKSYIELYKR